MGKHRSTLETLSPSPERPDFAREVRKEYEKIVPEGTVFDWVTRSKAFVREGSDKLWQKFNNASNSQKLLYGGALALGAYVGFKILKKAIDGLFSLGTWLVDKISGIRKDSLSLILKVSLGASAAALIPLLYQAIAKGNLSLDEVFSAWDENGTEGVIKLLAVKFPAGVKSITGDLKAFILSVIGADKFKNWFEGKSLPGVEILPTIPKTERTPGGAVVEDGTSGLTPEEVEDMRDKMVLSPMTAERAQRFWESPSLTGFNDLLGSLVENEGPVVVSDGKVLIMNSLGELLDLSRWLTFQYYGSVKDVLAAGQRDKELVWGDYLVAYFKEVPKFYIMAASLEVFNKLRGRHASLLIRPALSALKWGAWPLKLVGPAQKLLTGQVTLARFTKDGVIFLAKTGKNLAKLTPRGSLLFWQGGKFVSREALKIGTKLGARAAFGRAIVKTYTRTIGKKILNFTNKSFLKKLGASAGVTGAVAAGLWADDATVVGVLDDIVAAGLTLWLASDIYDIIKLTREAIRFKNLIIEQEALNIVAVEGVDSSTKERLESLNDAEISTESAALEVLMTMPKAVFRLTRENGRTEEYTMVRGKVLAVKILEADTVLAEFSESDVEILSQELPPPKTFAPWKIDYELEEENLLAQYRLAFLYVVNETGWSELAYDLKNTETIEVKRRSTQQVMFIRREGDQWYLGADKTTGFNLFQAISLANLVNRVEDLLREASRRPSGDTPFYAEPDGIYISRLFNDTTLLGAEEDSWYQQFYQGQLGLNPETITDSLNRQYQDSIRPRLNEQTDDYMKDFIPD